MAKDDKQLDFLTPAEPASASAPGGDASNDSGAPTGDASTGDASTGAAPTGDASVAGAATGSAPTGDAPIAGGAPTGRAPTGDAPIAGGAPIGGAPTGDAPIGGAPIGGAPIGGAPIGGAPTGGAPIGGAPTGGAPIGGAPTGDASIAGASIAGASIDSDGALTDDLDEMDEPSWGDDTLVAPVQIAAPDDEVMPALPWLADAPPIPQIIGDPRTNRFAGAILGAAIGDAMGHPTEFVSSVAAIRDAFGPDGVTGFALYWEHDGQRFAPYTDDTQMAEVVLRALLWGRDAGADLDATMRKMAEGFVAWAEHPQGGHRAPGNACLRGCQALAEGVHWSEAGGAEAGGCGSVMRAYPFGLVFARDLERAEAWAVAHSKLTHRDPIALAASAAMAVGMARILRDDAVDVVLSEMVAAACRQCPKTAGMMTRAIDEAQSGVPPAVTFERLQAWAAHEAIAAAVYLLARHPDDPRAAILEGANTPGDSDSIATLGGALVGARRGLAALPSEWVDDIERRGVLLALSTNI